MPSSVLCLAVNDEVNNVVVIWMLFHTPEDSTEIVLEKVHGLNGIRVVQIAAGAEHSALITGKFYLHISIGMIYSMLSHVELLIFFCIKIAESGVIMTWGWGEHGQLGLGNTFDQIIPQVVTIDHELPHKSLMSRVYCGSGFTFCLEGSLAPVSKLMTPHSG